MISDSEKAKRWKSRPRRAVSASNKLYSDSQKLEAVKLWLVTGNLTQTAAALDINLSTIKVWKASKWWNEIAQEIRNEGRIALSNRLKTIASKAMDVTLDRLENGDFQYDPKSGELIRRPVLMRDANRVANDMIKANLEIEQRPVDEETQKATQDRLQALAETFAGFAKKVKRIEVLDIEENK